MALCTVSQLKVRLGIAASDVSQDALLAQLVTGVSARCQGRPGSGRPLEEAARVWALDVPFRGLVRLLLPVWPVVSVAEVLERTSLAAWSEAETLTADEDYLLEAARGELLRVGVAWPVGPAVVRVTATAGYVPAEVAEAAGFVLGSGQTLLPDELVDAALMQCVHDYQTRLSPAGAGQSVAGGSASISLGRPGGLLDGVAEVFRSPAYRRAM